MTKKNRILASILAVAFVIVMLFSVCFIVAESNHICIGEDCPICYQISICENTLKTIGLAGFEIGVTALSLSLTAVSPCSVRLASLTDSLVSLKVKLSD